MSKVKGVCPHCGAVVEINYKINEPNFECANCHKICSIEAATNNYNKIISNNVKHAERCMKESTNYTKAFEYYYKNVELKPDDVDCLCGSVIAKLYQSDLINVTIKEATELLLKHSEDVEISRANIETLSSYLHEMYLVCFKYLGLISNIVRNGNTILDEPALDLYIKTNKEIISFIDAYLDIHKGLEELSVYLKEIPEVLLEKKALLESTIKEEFLIKNNDINLNKRYGFNNKLIKKNNVFEDKSLVYKIRIALYIGMAVGFITSIVGLIMTLNNNIKIPALIVLGIGLVLFVGCYFVGHSLRSKSLGLNY